MLDYYSSVNDVPYIMLNSTSGADLPDNTGKRVSVTGNLSSGKSVRFTHRPPIFTAQ